MRRSSLFSALAGAGVLAALGGCAAKIDDPENPPQIGRWGMMLDFTSASAEGQGVRREDFIDRTGSAALSRLFSTSGGPNCTEPSLLTPDYLIDIFGFEFGDCSPLPESQSGAIALRCVLDGEISELRFGGTLGETSGQGTVTVSVTPEDGGSIKPGTLSAAITWTRHGDCR